MTPRFQRVLDALDVNPALIKTATWDVVAWNRPATLLMTDYAKLPREERNILRLMSGSSRIRAAQEHWESVARFVVGAFRADAARAGATTEITKLVEELSRTSPDFDRLWRDNVVAHGEGLKRIRHAELGRTPGRPFRWRNVLRVRTERLRRCSPHCHWTWRRRARLGR